MADEEEAPQLSKAEFEALLKEKGTRLLPARPGVSHILIEGPETEDDEEEEQP